MNKFCELKRLSSCLRRVFLYVDLGLPVWATLKEPDIYNKWPASHKHKALTMPHSMLPTDSGLVSPRVRYIGQGIQLRKRFSGRTVSTVFFVPFLTSCDRHIASYV